MEKVGGSVFAETWGSALILLLMHFPLSFCKNAMTNFSANQKSAEKLPKIVATRGEISSLKFTKYRLAAGL